MVKDVGNWQLIASLLDKVVTPSLLGRAASK
jgi:hypothetical protein